MFLYEYATVNNTFYYTTGLLGNLNGDGLVDYILAIDESGIDPPNGAYIHTGTSTADWTATTTMFAAIRNMVTQRAVQQADALVDINGDGLDDWMKSGGSTQFCINTGTGWDASCDSAWNIATSTRHANGWDRGIRFLDVNGDELVDYVRSYEMPSYSNNTVPHNEVGNYNYVYLNTGSGFAAATSSFPLPPGIITRYVVTPGGIWAGEVDYNELVDWNGDGISDDKDDTSTTTATTRPDLLTRINYSAGGNKEIEYKFSSQFGTNPSLPYPVLVVTKTTLDDGSGTKQITTYRYEGGKLYLGGDIRDRRFATFKTITKTSPLNVTKTYFNQGDTVDTGSGEQTDDFAQIGKPYREDIISLASTTMRQKFNRWDMYAQGNGRQFVFLDKEMTRQYDEDTDSRDLAIEFTYATSTGDLTQVVQKGEVTGSGDGAYSDTGNDSVTKIITYASSSTSPLSLPMQETIKNNSNTTVKESKFYYDNLSAGSATKGNLTKQENWITGSSYASTTKAYDSYGLVTQFTDPRSNITTYTRDSFDLYPATTTDPAGNITGAYYDYSSGKVKRTIDQNGLHFATTYDGLDRPLTEQQPDLSTPSTLVNKRTYAYTDTYGAKSVLRTDYLNSATSSLSYQYFDGLSRLIQERKEAEATSEFAVKDFSYSNLGLLHRESLPYFSSGSSKTSPTTTPALYSTYLYDALQRVTAIGTAVGTTTNTYDQWVTTVTDPIGGYKDLTNDAYGNLTQVVEHDGASSYTTAYTYDAANNLTKITDADGNVRNFTYDGLWRRTAAEDLHAAADGTYGSWSYTYDTAGNLASYTDPKSQTVNYSYDALNRAISEDYAGAGSTEIVYGYDTCGNGKGRLCAATTTDAVSVFAYNALGLTASETKTIDGGTYATSYLYDRQGNPTDITYPDQSIARYGYNEAGQVETVSRKPANSSTYLTAVSDLDYAPTGAIAYKKLGNGVESTYTYSASELYRLKNLSTIASSTWSQGGGGSGPLGLLELPHYALSIERILAKATPQFLAIAGDMQDIASLAIEATTTPENTEMPEPSLQATTTDVLVEEVVEIPEVLVATTTEESVATSTVEITPPVEEAIVGEPAVEAAATTTPHTTTDTALVVASTTAPLSTSTAVSIQIEEKKTEERKLKNTMTPAPSGSMRALLEGKGSYKRANIKGEEIARRFKGVREQRDRYEIEIVEIEPIEGGLEAFVRAWDSEGKQIGFGTDGTVDMERFRIFNPPILVADEYGDIVQEWEDEDPGTGEILTYSRRLREDPREALLQTIEHALSVMKNIHGPGAIKKGKRGNTVSTFYSDAGGDGAISTNSPCSFASGRDGTCGIFNVNTTSASQNFYEDTDYGMRMLYFPFNTSSIPSGNTVSSATFSVYGAATGMNTPTRGVGLLQSNQASLTTLSSSDYLPASYTEIATRIPIVSLTTSAYNDYSISSSSVIAKGSGFTKLMLMNGPIIDNDSVSGSWYFNFYTSNQSGTTQDPKLVVEHSDGGSPEPDETILQSLVYTYDAVGNIIAIAEYATSTGASRQLLYEYDQLSRLTLASTTAGSPSFFGEKYSYTPTGNMLRKASTTAISTTANVYALDLEKDGSQYASITDAAQTGLDITGNFTVEAWLKFETLPTTLGYSQSIISKAGTNPDAGWDLRVSADNNKLDWVENNTTQYTADSVLSTGTWWHVAVTYNGTNIKMYVNGDLELNTAYGGHGNSSFAVNVGRGPTYTNKYFDGLLDDVRVWSRELSASEIDALSSSTTPGIPANTANLEAWWKFENAYTDASGNSNTLTAYGPPSFAADVPYAGTAAATSSNYAYATSTGYQNPHAPVSYFDGTATTTYSYDTNGNLLSTARGATTTTYVWDYRNRLTAAGQTGQATTTFAYDYAGQRVWKKVGTTATTTYVSKYFDKTGATTTAYLFLPSGELIATVEGNGTATTTSYMHSDHLGGTNVVTDENGTVVQVLDYYPYGAKRIESGSDISQREFIGQFFDEESDLSYLQARYLDSQRGQFLSQDPVFWHTGTTLQNQGASNSISGSNWSQNTPSSNSSTYGMGRNGGISQEQLAWLSDPQAQNSYGYARNNPIRFKDPEGLWYKEFITGQQSWSSFHGELGEAAYTLGQSSSGWNFAMNHPYATGALTGLLAAPAAQAGVAGVAAFGAATYPGVGAAYAAKQAFAGVVYSTVAGSSLAQIPKTINSLSQSNLRSPSTYASTAFSVGIQVGPTFVGGHIGTLADIHQFVSALGDALGKLQSSNSSNKKK